MQDVTKQIVDFLTSVGIRVHEGSVATDSFLPGLSIVNGSLVYDRLSLQWPGDLLHEAGHIATVPTSIRALLSDSLDHAPLVPHSGEAEATAWAYAATVHLGLDPSVLFHHGGYHGKSSSLITAYSCGVYLGSYGLTLAGMTLVGIDATSASTLPYPHMSQWLRD